MDHVEALEKRSFFSASASVAPGLSQAMISNFVLEASKNAKKQSSPPAYMIGSYGGSYQAYESFGNVYVTIDSQEGNKFFGSIIFSSYAGGSVSGAFNGTLAKNLKLAASFKSGNTNLECKGDFNPGSESEMTVRMSGKFMGRKIVLGLGEFAVTGALG